MEVPFFLLKHVQYSLTTLCDTYSSAFSLLSGGELHKLDAVARDIGEDASDKKSLDALAKDLLASDAQQQHIDAGLKKQARPTRRLASPCFFTRCFRAGEAA